MRPEITMGRFEELLSKIKASNPNNPLFDDLFYKLCLRNALDSPCQKMKFGAVVVYTGANKRVMMYEFVYEGCNKTIDGHAEEIALWEVVKKCVPLDECEMYIAGVYSNGLPYIKTEPEFTCLCCAKQIYYSGLKKVWVPVIDHWEGLTGEECVKTARAFAMKEKTI